MNITIQYAFLAATGLSISFACHVTHPFQTEYSYRYIPWIDSSNLDLAVYKDIYEYWNSILVEHSLSHIREWTEAEIDVTKVDLLKYSEMIEVTVGIEEYISMYNKKIHDIIST